MTINLDARTRSVLDAVRAGLPPTIRDLPLAVPRQVPHTLLSLHRIELAFGPHLVTVPLSAWGDEVVDAVELNEQLLGKAAYGMKPPQPSNFESLAKLIAITISDKIKGDR